MSKVWFVTGASSGIGAGAVRGGDAVSGIVGDLEARLAEVKVHVDLSVSTDGSF